ncbi:MAG: sulfotransferase [Nitrospiria bacterium]
MTTNKIRAKKKPIEEETRSVARNPYLFVVGCPRSGTTLLQRMLDHHPQLAVANDTHFIPVGIQRRFNGADPLLTPDLVDRVVRYRRFPRLGISLEEAKRSAKTSETYSTFVTALYDTYAQKQEKQYGGEKTPDYVKYLPMLHGLFPWVKTAHIIRDGRDVALSALEWAKEKKGPGRYVLWQEDPVAVCALWWHHHVSQGMQDGNALGPAHYFELRYESLSTEPQAVLSELSRFLDIPFSKKMVHYYEGKTRMEAYKKGEISVKKAWLPATPKLRDWRKRMEERDLALFEALAGNLLSKLGYERAFPSIPPRMTTLAEKYRRWWDAEMVRKQSKRQG